MSQPADDPIRRRQCLAGLVRAAALYSGVCGAGKRFGAPSKSAPVAIKGCCWASAALESGTAAGRSSVPAGGFGSLCANDSVAADSRPTTAAINRTLSPFIIASCSTRNEERLPSPKGSGAFLGARVPKRARFGLRSHLMTEPGHVALNSFDVIVYLKSSGLACQAPTLHLPALRARDPIRRRSPRTSGAA
jgi:hypothetical protein